MLIFDMDGTLIDSNGIWKDVDIAFLKKRGFAYTRAYYEGVAHTIFPLAAKFTKEYCHLSESTEEMTSMSVVLGGIAGIALLVGGIGIMNIMLVTVTERTREIGIKKSIGAPRREIVGQFLVEAAILSALGGLIGIALGYLLSLILGKAMYDLILYPDALVTAGAFAFSVAIGIVFGIYPAAKASGLQPVDALRAD